MHIPKAPQLSRRTILRGLGATLSLPFFEAMMPTAYGAVSRAAARQAGPPLRFALFSCGAGTVHESWKPKNTGALTELPSILKAMEPYKDDMLLLSGLSHSNKGSHGVRHKGHLTGVLGLVENKPLKETNPNASSFDQAIAQAIGDQTFLASLEMGNLPAKATHHYRNGDEQPLEPDPRRIFERMFKDREPRIPEWGAASSSAGAAAGLPVDSVERSVLDLVMQDTKRLQAKLGKTDRDRLDQYLTSVRSIEKQIAFLEREVAMRKPDRAPSTALDYMAPHVPEMIANGTYDYDQLQKEDAYREVDIYGQYLDLLGDLMILALQTDTTRVVGLNHEGINEWTGVVTVGFERHYHSLQHTGNGRQSDEIAREGCRQVHEWFTRRFAHLVGKMKAIDEGGTSLLDNTLLMYTSYMAHGGHSGEDFPVALLGNAQGTLRPGRHVAYQEKTPHSNLMLEIMNRFGLETDEFGESKTSPNAAYNGRLPDLV